MTCGSNASSDAEALPRVISCLMRRDALRGIPVRNLQRPIDFHVVKNGDLSFEFKNTQQGKPSKTPGVLI
jgi:hypothetical protein